MQSFITRLRTPASPDSGFSLIEVLIAMMVFMILAVGVAFSLLSVLSLTNESRARQTATNLAAQEIDLGRSAKDVFTLGDVTRTVTNAGLTFRVTRESQWVSGAGEDNGCGTGTGALQYKRISVTVTWDGMRAGAAPARADTLLAPRDRINDPALGTIIVSVFSASGSGSAGVSVSAAPTAGVAGNGASSLSGPVTDAQGCSYLLRVAPGTYDVTISRAGYVDQQQVPSPVRSTGITVAAGASAAAGFVFDLAGSFTVSYASNAPAGTVQFPGNLDTSFISTAGVYVSSGSPTASKRTLQLFPFPSGYAVMAGKYVAPSDTSPGCISVDPAAWPADQASATADVRTQSTTAAAAGLPMGLVTVSGATGQFLTAVSAPGAGTDDPGCSVPMTYTFSALASSGKVALPYGSWTLYKGATLGAKTTIIPAASITVAAPSGVAATSGVVTLDPRSAPAPSPSPTPSPSAPVSPSPSPSASP
jgi:prepilin-type N-terminal cleavage/methylation domain-containing protein